MSDRPQVEGRLSFIAKYSLWVGKNSSAIRRRAIYTTNANKSLKSVILAAIKKHKVFPTDNSVRKVIYPAIKNASKKCSMPIQNCGLR